MTAIQCWAMSCGFRHSNRRKRGNGGVKEQAAVYFQSFCSTQLPCQRAPTEPTPVRWCVSFEKWGSMVIDMEMWYKKKKNIGGLCCTQRQGENKDYLVVWAEWKRQVQVNMLRSPLWRLCDTFLRPWRLLFASQLLISKLNRQITFLAEWLSTSLSYFNMNAYAEISCQ